MIMDSKNYTDYISCICGFRGLSIETRQHRECPSCHMIVEACCEGNSCD